MKKLVALCAAGTLLFLLVVVLHAQEPTPAPKPTPEHDKLGYYVGKWAEEGEVKASAFGPGGKYTATSSCDWLPGKFAVLCKEDGTMMGGEIHGTSIMSYDTNQKSYIYFEANNWGELSYYHGVVDGDTWTWDDDFKVNGQPIHGRFVLKQLSPDTASFNFAMAMGSGQLTTIMEGQQTRQK